MSKQHPHLSLLARLFITGLTLAGLGLVSRGYPTADEQITAGANESVAVDVVAASLAKSGANEVLPRVALPTAAPAPLPTAPGVPTAVPGPPSQLQWAEVSVETQLRPAPDPRSPAVQFLPRASSLRVLGVEWGWAHVRYGGNGDDHKPGEGWVNSADISLRPAPGWVEAVQTTTAWSAAVGGQRAGTVPARAVVQTLEDQGNRVRVFYLGDGLGHDHFDGWIDSTDLGPAGPLLVSQRYGLRMLTKEDLEAIDSGKGTWLRVPYRTQLDGGPSADANCGPAAVAMVLQYYRVASTNSEVRAVADRLQGTHDPEGGFAIEFLAGAAARFGLKPLEMEAGQDLLKKWSLDDARRQLSEGHPIIAQLRFRAMPGRELSDYGDDHYVVLAGMLGDDFIYNDSVDVDGPGYGRVISAADLKLAWGSSYFPFAGFAVSAP